VLPLTDPLAHARGPVRLEDLAGRDWVRFEEGHGLSDHAAEACRLAGFTPRGVVETAQVEAAARLAAAGVGPALLPHKNVPPDLTGHVRRLEPPVVWRVCAFVCERAFPPLAAAFADVLDEGPWLRRPPADARELTP